VVPFPVSIGQPCPPPGLATVEEVEERNDVPDGTVLAVNLRGYLWRGEFLRKPNIVVAQNTSSEETAQT